MQWNASVEIKDRGKLLDSQPVSFFGSRHEIKGHEPTKDWSDWLN